MDYEKLHRDSLELGRKLIEKNPELREWVESKLPELKKTRDEEVKDAINYAICQSTHPDGTLINGVTRKEAVTWLLSQGLLEPSKSNIEDMVSEYRDNPEKGNESGGRPINCMVRAYSNGIRDAISKFNLVAPKTAGPNDFWVYIQEFCVKFGRIPKDQDELGVLVDYVIKRQSLEVGIEKEVPGSLVNPELSEEIQRYIQEKKLLDYGFLIPDIANHFATWQSEKILGKATEERIYQMEGRKFVLVESQDVVPGDTVDLIIIKK